MDKTASRDGDRQHAPVIFGICALMTAVFLLLQGLGFVPLKEAEGYLQDWSARLGRKTPVNPQLVLIGIDRPSYDDVILADEAKADPVLAALRERYPWSRTVWAALIERLADGRNRNRGSYLSYSAVCFRDRFVAVYGCRLPGSRSQAGRADKQKNDGYPLLCVARHC